MSSSCSCSSAQILSKFSIGEVKLGVGSVTDFFSLGYYWSGGDLAGFFLGGFRGS